MSGIRDEQGCIEIASNPEIAAQLEEDVGVDLKLLALITPFAFLDPVDDRALFDAQTFKPRYNSLADQLVVSSLALKEFTVDPDAAIRTGSAGQFDHLGNCGALIDTLART